MAAAAEPQLDLNEDTSLPAIPPFTDRSEFDLLLACCAVHANPDRLRAILSRPLNWARLLQFVDHHRIVPQLYSQLSAFSHLIPAQLLNALRFRYQDNARKALWFTAELLRIASYLESAGIKALPYKGPALAQALYGEVTHREFSDLDILILPADVPKAKTALLELGYKPEIELAPHREHAYLTAGYEIPFRATTGGNLLELQWRVLPRFYSIDLDVADFFQRADEINLGDRGCIATPWVESSREAAADYSSRRKPWAESGTPPSPRGAKDDPGNGLSMRTLCAKDLLLVLCVHAAKHVWARLSWLCDIAQLATRQLDWKAIQDEARRLGIERILSLNLLLAHRLLGSDLPAIMQKRLQEDASTTALADQIVRVIERCTHYDTESLPYFRLMMRLRERRQDQARFLWRLAVTPTRSEWATVDLPKPLQPLYHVVRLSRLAKRLASAR